MAKYTILDITAPCNVDVPTDVLVVGVNYTWKFCDKVNMVYFTRFDAFMEFMNGAKEGAYGIPVCNGDLANEANRVGRFSVLRNFIRAQKLKYHDYIGNAETVMRNVLPGMQYVKTNDGNNCAHDVNTEPAVQKTATTAIPEERNYNPMVSVIVTHYNRGLIIQNSITSILDQTYDNIEILIVDDCSTDKEFAVLTEYLSGLNNPKIKLYRCNKNCGPYVCKNEMIKIAGGEYIAMHDSDDISKPQRIEQQVDSLKKTGAAVCYVNASRGKTKYVQCFAAAMYAKSVFADIGFFDAVRYGADSEFNERIKTYYDGSKIITINSNLYEAKSSVDGLTSIIPPESKTRTNYYDACRRYIHSEKNKENLYLAYPAAYRKFYAAPEMVANIDRLACTAVNLQKNSAENAAVKKINVVISAYNCAEYIEQCLDSALSQTYAYHKILLAVDGCLKTLEKVNSIAGNYRNIEVYYAPENTGPYMVYNSLIALIPDDEYFVIFGADDVMYPNMLECLAVNDVAKICKHDGVLFIKKSEFAKIGGFRPWRCAADSDAVFRMRKLYAVHRTPIYFTLRKHDKQLTTCSSTNLNSNLRLSYIKITDENMKSENPVIYIKPECNPIRRVDLIRAIKQGKSVTVNMATYPARRQSFITCVNSLLKIPLIDKIRVYLNEYRKIPEDFPKNKKIQYVVGKKNLSDTGKFYWACNYNNEYYFTVDDDLIYSEDYFTHHIQTLQKYNGNIFVTLHGKLTPARPKNFMDVKKPIFHCLRENPADQWVMIGGTGVMAFDNEKFKIELDMFRYHGMCDLWVALFCQTNRIPILCRKHPSTAVTLINPQEQNTLWDRRQEMADRHNEVIGSVTWQLFSITLQE